ncbi:MAG: hypothetical protein LBG22_09590 [Treponema sp.]|jgi:hypothetical protein|nr:hypothetical protein [Treponema sp.]
MKYVVKVTTDIFVEADSLEEAHECLIFDLDELLGDKTDGDIVIGEPMEVTP